MNGVVFQRIAASVAQERSFEAVLGRIVAELHAQPNVALTRIWLLDEREKCDVCAKMHTDGERHAALHLSAGAGRSLHPECNEDWSKLNGSSRCIQLGAGKVGRIGATGESVFVDDAEHDQRWSLNREWVRSESIAGFTGHPLSYRGEIVGVIVLFSRERLTQADFELLRGFADLAAIAIANARDFEAVERVRLRLETENAFLREELDRIHAIGRIVDKSPAIRKLQDQIAAAASSVLPLPRTDRDLRRFEEESIRAVLETTNWKVYGPRGAADVLQMKPTTLASRMKSLGIRKPAA